MSWRIPRLWPDSIVAILATGPSLKDDVVDRVMAVHAAGLCHAIAINDAFRVAPWADMLVANDFPWWDVHRAEVASFAGLKVTCSQFPGTFKLDVSGNKGFDPRPEYVRTGSNSSLTGAHVAAHLGAKRIVFFGLDLSSDRGEHFFGSHPSRLRNTRDFGPMRRRFYDFAEAISVHRPEIQLLNATPASALEALPIIEPSSDWWA